jgi:hypothetical protein
VDEYTIETLKGKKGVFETILGESHTAGILDSGEAFDMDTGMEGTASDEEFQRLLKAHVKSIGMKMFLSGDQIAKARASGIEYKMAFEKGGRGRGRKQKEKFAVTQEDLTWFTE